MADAVEVFGPTIHRLGLHPTIAFVEAARQRVVRNIRRVPYPDHSFDAAFFDEVALQVGPSEAALKELRRVVRPGATLAR